MAPPDPPAHPVPATPPRPAPSVRRTSHIDMIWHDDGPGTLRLVGRARDVATDGAGTGRVLREAAVECRTAPDLSVVSLVVEPAGGDPAGLEGISVRAGFRARARAAFPEEHATPLALLLDDLPVAALIASYASVRSGLIGGRQLAASMPPDAAHHQADLCAGWDATGTMIAGIRSGHGILYRDGPDDPGVVTEDPLDWHDDPPLMAGAMRRRRRIDVLSGEPRRVEAWFRDAWGRPDGTVEVLHEYTVELRLEDDQIAAIYAGPQVLPFGECPRASAHVGRLVGAPIGELRRIVPDRLTKLSSCTHLNDLLRALADVPALEADLEER